MARPISVLFMIHQVSPAAASRIRKNAGKMILAPRGDANSNSAILPKLSICSGSERIQTVPTKVSKNPRNRYWVPIVTISDGALSWCTRNPLIKPSSPPPTAAATKTSRIGAAGKYVTTTCVTEYIDSAAIAVNETSMPPAARMTNTPSANSPITTLARAMSISVDA